MPHGRRTSQDPFNRSQLLAGYVKQRAVREYAIEMAIRQIELEEILLPYFATAAGTRHDGEMRGAFQTYRSVTAFSARWNVSPVF
jgi:hypothetical protein